MAVEADSLFQLRNTPQEVRSQLERMLQSGIFTRSERLSAFLRYVVEQTLAGRSAGLKEQVLGSQLYRKGGEFDGATDPIVRVDARRLRDKLREYYSEFPQDPIIISLPKGTYAPVFKENPAVNLLDGRNPIRDSAAQPRWIALAVVGILVSIIGYAVAHRRADAPVTLMRVTSFPGEIGAPSLSPDGAFVAFSWKGPKETGPLDIWVKAVGTEELRQLTETPGLRETSPAWSPDGREIAFVRARQGVFVVPQTGGPERKVSASGTHVAWVPDGRSVLIRDQQGDAPYSIYQIVIDSLERRRLTRPPGGIGDWRFNVSPDGVNLAVIRYERPGVGDLYLVSMKDGEPRRLTNWNASLGGVVWTPDGRDLIYSAEGLWRIPANLSQPGRGSLLAEVPDSASNPSISRPAPGRPARLAFQKNSSDINFRIIDLAAPLDGGVFQAVRPFAAATRLDYPGMFSPDGGRIAFVSARSSAKPQLASTAPELWISGIDGTGLRPLASAPHLSVGPWSPDGKRIVYDAAIDGNSDIFVVDVDGGKPERLTFERSIDALASWSRDGRWIYFTSTRDGSRAAPDIWRIPADGGQAVRITYHGGLQPRESADGKYSYYVDRSIPGDGATGTARLMRVPAAGGPEVAVLSGLTPLWWSVTETGILFLTRESESDAIDRYSFNDRKVIRLGKLPSRAAPIGTLLNASLDGRWMIVSQKRLEQDLMLLDNFR